MADDRALTSEMEDLGQPADGAATPAVDSIPGAGSRGRRRYQHPARPPIAAGSCQRGAPRLRLIALEEIMRSSRLATLALTSMFVGSCVPWRLGSSKHQHQDDVRRRAGVRRPAGGVRRRTGGHGGGSHHRACGHRQHPDGQTAAERRRLCHWIGAQGLHGDHVQGRRAGRGRARAARRDPHHRQWRDRLDDRRRERRHDGLLHRRRTRGWCSRPERPQRSDLGPRIRRAQQAPDAKRPGEPRQRERSGERIRPERSDSLQGRSRHDRTRDAEWPDWRRSGRDSLD